VRLRKDKELAQIVNELRERTLATTENICPPVDQIEFFPTQKMSSATGLQARLIRDCDASFGGGTGHLRLMK